MKVMPQGVFKALLDKRADMNVRMLPGAKPLHLAASKSKEGKALSVTYDREVSINTELLIRHGKSLMVRNLKWLVAIPEQEVPECLLGRPILEALGMDTKEILEAAIDKHGGAIDASLLLPSGSHREGSVARLLASGLYHSDGALHEDDGIEGTDYQVVDLGIDTEEEIQDAFHTLVSGAHERGMSGEGSRELQNMLLEYRDVFRIRLGPDPAAKAEPMALTLKPGYTPHIAKVRRFTPDQRQFMEGYARKLHEFSFIEPNNLATWVSAPVVAPKPPPAKYRLTFDIGRVNQATEPISWVMTHIETSLLDVSGSTCFANVDFCSAYWQLPVDDLTSSLQSVWTLIGVFRSLRSLQGVHNSAPNFQGKVEPLFAALRDNLICWLDDVLIQATSEKQLLSVLVQFFQICRRYRLKVSAKKSVLFTKKVKWCGWIIDETGVQCDPRRLNALREGSEPVTGEELSQFVHCLRWMSSYIPDFSRRVAPLRGILEDAYPRSGKRTTRSVRNIKLRDLYWGPQHSKAFQDLKDQLLNAVKLSHRDHSKTLCIFTDASDERCAAVVVQTDSEDMGKELHERRMEPLAFLGSAFNQTQKNWSTIEKEAFAIYQAFSKKDYLLGAESDIHLYTDHRNLLFVFSPTSVHPMLGRHTINKVLRWALYLSQFMYTIEHVPGGANLFADILTRWLGGYRGSQTGTRRLK